jgi:hypothetical protein
VLDQMCSCNGSVLPEYTMEISYVQDPNFLNSRSKVKCDYPGKFLFSLNIVCDMSLRLFIFL